MLNGDIILAYSRDVFNNPYVFTSFFMQLIMLHKLIKWQDLVLIKLLILIKDQMHQDEIWLLKQKYI